jgi:ComF family protein
LTIGEEIVCISCLSELPVTNFTEDRNNPLEKSFFGRIQIEFATALLYYSKDNPVQSLIEKLKYKNDEGIGSFLGNWLGGQLKSNPHFEQIDIIVPVPLHPKKLKKRGYNQLTKFGEQISSALQKPYREDILSRKIYVETQTKKDRSHRILNEEIFTINNLNDLHGKHVLLIDDVITTGATIESCCKALLKAQNVKITLAAMAFTE